MRTPTNQSALVERTAPSSRLSMSGMTKQSLSNTGEHRWCLSEKLLDCFIEAEGYICIYLFFAGDKLSRIEYTDTFPHGHCYMSATFTHYPAQSTSVAMARASIIWKIGIYRRIIFLILILIF